MKRHPQIAEKTVYTGTMDEFFDFCLGHLEYRTVRFEHEVLDCDNWQGCAVVNYTSEQAEEISSLTVDIYKYVNESWANWIVNGGIEEQWDAYVDQLNKMGLERLMEIYQEALDVYNNAG